MKSLTLLYLWMRLVSVVDVPDQRIYNSVFWTECEYIPPHSTPTDFPGHLRHGAHPWERWRFGEKWFESFSGIMSVSTTEMWIRSSFNQILHSWMLLRNYFQHWGVKYPIIVRQIKRLCLLQWMLRWTNSRIMQRIVAAYKTILPPLHCKEEH